MFTISMRITGVPNNIYFGKKNESKPETVVHLGDDGAMQEGIREKMREDILTQSIPYWELNQQYRLEEYDMHKLESSLNSKIKYKPISQLPDIKQQKKQDDEALPLDERLKCWELLETVFYNVAPLSDEKHCYSGSMLNSKQELERLRQAKIKTVIDLRSHGVYDIFNEVDDIKYFNKIETAAINFFEHPIFSSKERYCIQNKPRYSDCTENIDYAEYWENEKQNFVDNLVEYTDLINQGNFYIGCHFGTQGTQEGLALNNVVNEKTQLIFGRGVLLTYAHNYLQLLENLNEDDRKRLGMSDEFYEQTLGELKYYADNCY